MTKPTPIFIPTYGRPDIKTLNSLTPALRKRVVLVVEDSDKIEKFQDELDVYTLICPIQGKGIHLVRNWLMEYCWKYRIRCCIMLDDDLRLTCSYQDKETGKKKFKSNGIELENYFERAEHKALESRVGLVGFSQEYFNTTDKVWQMNKDNASTYFVNVKNAFAGGANFLLPSIDDRNFQCMTIAAGYEVWSLASVAVNQIVPVGIGGEHSIGDRGARTRRALLKLCKRYPRFVINRGEIPPKRYGSGLKVTFYLDRMYKAVQRGEDVTK